MSNRREREAQHRRRMDKKHARNNALKAEAAQLLERTKAACAKTDDKISPDDLGVFVCRASKSSLVRMREVAERNEEMAEHFLAKKQDESAQPSQAVA